MLKYTGQRLLAMVLLLFIILTVDFLTVRLMPGSIYDDEFDMTEKQRRALEAKYDLDKPLVTQYALFVKGIVTKWDWKVSITMNPDVSVWDIVRVKIPITMYINFLSLFITIPFGFLLAILAALRKNTAVDYGVSIFVATSISVPSFVFASTLQYFVAYKWALFPIIYQPNGTGAETLRSLLLPVVALSLGGIATITRYLRAELAETLGSDFMLLARTKGLNTFQSTMRHSIRNSIVPLMNILIPMFLGIMGGSLVVETIFAIPGMGGLTVQSIQARDYPVAMGSLMFYTTISLVTIFIVDMSYGFVDPRIRMGGRKS